MREGRMREGRMREGRNERRKGERRKGGKGRLGCLTRLGNAVKNKKFGKQGTIKTSHKQQTSPNQHLTSN